MTNEFILDVLTTFAPDDCSSIWWRTDGEYAPITFFVNCNDVFAWACADAEDITPESLPILKQSIEDVRSVLDIDRFDRDREWRIANIDRCHWMSFSIELFCSRMRKMRPQGACYPMFKELWPLFDACGSEREIDEGNPCKPGEQLDMERF